MLPLIVTLLFLLATISAWYSGSGGLASDPGLGWHLETGNLILQNKTVPTVDPFLALPQGMRPRLWVCDQWLGDVILQLLWRSGGWPLLYATTLTLFILSFYLLSSIFSRLNGVSALGTAFAAFFVTKLAAVQLIIRPVQFSFLFFALQLLLLSRVKGRRLWLLPLFFLLWANVHPGFILGLIVLCIFSILEVWKTKNFSSALIFAVSTAATLINPAGSELYRSFLSLGSSSYFMSLHQEWKAITFDSIEGEFYIYAIVLIAFSFWKEPIKNKWLLVSAILLGVWSLKSVRVLPYFVLVACPYFGRGIESAKLSLFRKYYASSWTYAASIVLLCIICVLVSAGIFPLPQNTTSLGPRPNFYPYETVAWLKDRCSIGQPCPIISLSDWGGFITFEGEGKLRPVIDDRNTLVGEDWYKTVALWVEECKGFETLQSSFQSPYILIPKVNEQKCREHYPNFTKLTEDQNSIVATLG